MNTEEKDRTEAMGNQAAEAQVPGVAESLTEPQAAVAEKAALATRTAGPSANERTWAALAHASILLTFALGVSTGGLAVALPALVPLIIWLAFRERSSFVAFHAMQATIFQLGSLVVWILILVGGLVILVPTWIITILLLIVLVGLLLLPLALLLTVALPVVLVALPLVSLVYGMYGAFEVYEGRPFRYQWVADWIESRGMRPVSQPSPA